MSEVYLGLARTVGTQGPQGVWASGALAVPKGYRGHFGGIRGCQECIEGKQGLKVQVRMGIGGMGPLGGVGPFWDMGVYWGLAGTVGTQG